MKRDYVPMPLESFLILGSLSYLWFAFMLTRSAKIALGGFVPYVLICVIFIVLNAINEKVVRNVILQIIVFLAVIIPAICIVWLR